MNTESALTLIAPIGDLIHLCALYQAEFGRRSEMNSGSGFRAWTLYEKIICVQTDIAELLDADALLKPRHTSHKWWEQQDIPDVTTACELMQEATHLITCCTYAESIADQKEHSPAIFYSQGAMVGMLHPIAIRRALGNLATRGDTTLK